MQMRNMEAVAKAIRQGANVTRVRATGGATYKVIQVSNLEPYGIPLDELKTEQVDAKQVKSYEPQEGQLLLSLFATKLRAVEVTRAVAEASAFIGNNIAIITPDPKKIVGAYLLAVLNSRAFHARMERLTGGSTIAQISVSALKDIEIPVPSTRTQQRLAHAFLQMRDLVNAYEQLRSAQSDLMEHAILDLWEDTNSHG